MAALLVVVTCVGLESAAASGTIPPGTDLVSTLSELWRVIEVSQPSDSAAEATGA
ncbi:hypothetical protein [Amycolatopsis sp. WGS_07]|uniref:hypothetical protein n=1 Tax=Amycolatopsis sp. WGS_07 TaxID=3076764 RepID=UPI00387302E6